jgi:prepilin-type N-terminal cleavage/methylation domain-containing protein
MALQGKKSSGKIMGASGFTLLELVMVIALLSIIAVVAAPRMVNVTSANAGASAEKLRADIRYAQDLAMTRNQRVRVSIVSANTYQITIAGNPVVDPSTGRNNMVLSAGSTFGATTFNGSYVEFDSSLGVPYDGAGALTAIGSITVTASGQNYTITVTPQTGAVN